MTESVILSESLKKSEASGEQTVLPTGLKKNCSTYPTSQSLYILRDLTITGEVQGRWVLFLLAVTKFQVLLCLMHQTTPIGVAVAWA
jgi:hypothetical protein